MIESLRSISRRGAAVALAVFFACVASGDASAQGWLAGASAGTAKQNGYEVGGEIATRDESDVGYRAFGGYLFHPNFGGIISYVDLGTANYDGPAYGGFTDALSATAIDVSFLAGFAPGGQKTFKLFGTIGFCRWQQDVHYADETGPYDYEDTGYSLSYGAGGEVSVGSAARWGIHFEWQRFTNVGDETNSGHEYDRDLLSAGVVYRFGK